MRFGVAGTGYWAEQVHLPALRDKAGVDLLGVWGRDSAKAEATGRNFGIRSFASFADMLAAVDAVSFALPPDVQARLALEAARAGKHLLLEKPVALTPDDAWAIAEAVEAAGVGAVVFFTRCFTAAVESAIQALAAQSPWDACSGRFHAGALRPNTPYSNSAWRQQRGALWDVGPHALSVLLPVLGGVTEVCATHAAGLTTLALHHATGAASETTLTLHAEPADFGEAYVFTGGGRSARLDVPQAPRQQAFAAAIEEMQRLAAGRGDAPPRAGVPFAATVVAILAAAEQSLRVGRAVPVTPPPKPGPPPRG